MADQLLPPGELGKGKKLSHYESGEEGVGPSRARSRPMGIQQGGEQAQSLRRPGGWVGRAFNFFPHDPRVGHFS